MPNAASVLIPLSLAVLEGGRITGLEVGAQAGAAVAALEAAMGQVPSSRAASVRREARSPPCSEGDASRAADGLRCCSPNETGHPGVLERAGRVWRTWA